MRFMQNKLDRLPMTIIYFLPRYKAMKLQRFVKCQGAKLWNSIINKIKKSTSVKLFKKNYRAFLLNKYNI